MCLPNLRQRVTQFRKLFVPRYPIAASCAAHIVHIQADVLLAVAKLFGTTVQGVVGGYFGKDCALWILGIDSYICVFKLLQAAYSFISAMY